MSGAARSCLCVLLVQACPREQPPDGQVEVFIETNAPVPQIVSALRIDVQTEDGASIARLDLARPSPENWPTSFVLVNPSDAVERDVYVRLRAYPEGRVEPGGEPRPGVTIDRLVRVKVVPRLRRKVQVLLDGECFGTTVDLESRRSCVDQTRELQPSALLPSKESVELQQQLGTFARVACTASARADTTNAAGVPLRQDEVCVPGGALLFGNQEQFEVGPASALPERVVVVSPLRMDRFEVTVGRWKDARSRGFTPPTLPIRNEGALTTATPCTLTSNSERDGYPLNCVSWESARAFCKWLGGDLPSEVQYEYVAQLAGRPFKTTYPWGQSASTDCDAVIMERYVGGLCAAQSLLPAPAGAGFRDSTALGVRDLSGSMGEFLRDSWSSLRDACWMQAPLHDPSCVVPAQPHSVRGGAWNSGWQSAHPGERGSSTSPFAVWHHIGFRCVRAGLE